MSESTSRCGGLSEQSSTSSSGGLAEQSSTSSSGKPAEQSSTSSSGKPAEQSTTLENDKQQHTEQLTVATPSIAVSDSAPSIAISDKTSSTATTDPTSPSFVLSDPPPKDASTAPATIPDDFAKIIDLDDYPILEYPVNSESEFTEDDEDEKIIKMHSTTNATMRNHYICFPWMKEYYIRLKTVVNAPSSHKIRCQLIKYYCEQCVTEFSSRNIKAVRAGQLARNVRENLVIFHRWPREVSSPNADYSLELSKLLTVYIDLELKASMRGTETIEVVTDRICLTIEYYLLNGEIYFTLYALLHNSRCHKTHRELLTNVFEHVLTRLPTITSCNTPEKTVVMYIAAFRTWYELLSKKGTPDEPGKKQVIAKFKKIMKYDIRFLRSTKYAPRLPGLRSDPPNLDVLLNNVEVNFLMRLIDSDATISNPTEYCDLTVVRDDESDVSERFPFTKSPQPVQNSSSSSEASHTITHSDSVDQSCIIEVDGDEPVLARPTPQTEEQDGPWEYSLIRDSVKVEIPANMVDKTIDLTGEPAGFSYLLSFMNSLLASAQVLKKTRPTKTQCSEIIDVDADDDDDEDCAILPDSLEECSYISNTIPELTTDVTNHDVVSESNSIVPAPPSPDSGCSDSNNEVRSERYKHIEDKLPSVVIEAPSSSAEECSDMEPSASFADDSDTDEGLHPSIADETTEKSIEKVDLKIAASSSAENSNESSGMGLSSSDIDVNISVEPTDEGIDSPIPSVTTPLITVEDRDMQVDVTLPDEIIVKSVTDAEGDNSATKCDDMVVDIVENKKSTIPELMPIICKPKTNELIVEESMDKDETDDNAVVPCLQIQTVESISLSEYQQWLGKPPDLNAEPKPPDVEHTDDAVFDEMQCDEIDKEDNIESSEQLPNASPTCDETNDEEMPLIDDICVVDMKYKSQRTYTNKKTKQSQSTSNLQSQVVVHSVDIVKSPHPSSFATCSQAFEASSMESRKISGVESSTLLDTSAPILNSIEHNVPLIDMPLQQNESKSSLMVTSKFIHSLDPNSFEETDDEYDEMVCEENGKVTPPPTIEDEETVKEIVGESSRTLTLPPSNVEDTNMDDEHEANELVTISTSSNIADRDLTDDYEEIVEDSAKAAPPPSTIVYRANKLSVAHDFSDDEMSTDAPLHASPANANVVFRASALLPESDPPILDPLNSEPGPSQTNRQSGILKKRSRTESPKREHNVRFNPEAIMTDGSDIIKVGVDTLKPVSQIQVRKASKSKGLEKMTAPTSYRVAKAVNTTSYRLQTKEGDVTMQDEAQTASELNRSGYKYQCSTRSYVKEKKKGKGQPPRTPPTSVEKQEWIDKMSDHSQKVIARDKFERRLIVSITRINIDEYLKDPNQPITFFSRKVGHNVQYNRTKKVQFAKEYLHKQLSSSSLKRAATSSGCNQSPKKMRPNEVNPLKSVLRPPAPDPHASVPKTIPAPAPKTKSAPESTPALVTKPAPIPAPKINAAPEPTPAPKTISTPNQKPKSEQTPAPHSGGPVAKKVLSGMEKYLISFNRKFGITDSTVQPTERKSRGRRRGNNQNSSPRKQTASQSRSRKVKQDERRPHVTRPRRSVVSSAAVAQQPVASSSAQLHATTSPSVQPLSRKHKSKSRKSNFKSPEYYIRMDKRFGMKVETRCTQMNFSAFLQCTTECEIDSLRKPCAAEFLAGVASEPYEAIQEIVENTFKFCKTNVRYEGGLKPLPPPIYENVSDAEEDTTVSGTPSEYPVSNSICNTSALWCNVWGSLGNYTCQNTDKYKTDLHVPYGPLRRNLVTVRRYTLATVADERNRPAQPDILNLLVNSDLHLKQMPHSKLATFVKFLISWKKISPIEYNDDAELVGKFIKLLPHKNGRSKLMEEVSDAEQNILILLKGSIPELQQMPDSKLAKFVKLLLSTNKIPMIEYSDDGELVGQFIKFLQNKKWDKLNETNLERCVVSEDSETEASIDEVDDDIFTPAATDVHIDEVINEEVVTLDNANNIDMDPVVEEDAVDETVYKDHFNDTHEEVVSHEEVATSETQQSSVIQRMEDDDEAHHLTYDHQSLVHPDMEDDSQVSQHRVEDNLMFVDQTVVICENGNELDISQTTHNSIIAGDDYVEGVVPPIKETDHTHSDEFILEENSDNSELFESKSNHEEMQQESVLDTHDNAVYEGHDSDEEDAAPSTMHQYVDKSNPPSPSHFNSDSQPSPDYEKLESNLSQLVTSPKRPIASDTPDIGAEMECGESGNSTQVGTFTNDSYFFVSEVQHREEGEQVAPNNEIYHHLASQDDPTLNPTVIDLPTERITDLPTESIIDLPTEPITDPPTESIIELPTESIIVQPTKPIIDLPLERRTTTKKQKDEVLHANQCLIDPYPMALSQQPTVSVIVEPKKRGRKRKESDPTMCAAVKPKRQRKPAAPRAPKAPRKTKAALKKEAELNALIQQSHLQYVTYPAATSSIPTTQLYNNASLQQSLNAVCSSFASVNPIPSTSKRKPGRPTKVTKQLQSYNTFVPQLASASFLQGGFPNTSAYTQLPVYHTVTSNPMYRNDVGASSNQVNYASTRSTTTEVPTIDTAPSSTSRRKRKPKASQPIVGCPVEAVATGSDNREMTESPDLNFRVDKQGHRTYSNQRIASVFVPQELVQIIEGSQNAGGSDKLSVVPTTAYDAR